MQTEEKWSLSMASYRHPILSPNTQIFRQTHSTHNMHLYTTLIYFGPSYYFEIPGLSVYVYWQGLPYTRAPKKILLWVPHFGPLRPLLS